MAAATEDMEATPTMGLRPEWAGDAENFKWAEMWDAQVATRQGEQLFVVKIGDRESNCS